MDERGSFSAPDRKTSHYCRPDRWGQVADRSICCNKGMKSPFPGMDPYIERRWRNFHTSIVVYARDRLNESLPSDLAAYSEDRVYVEADGARVRTIYPDVLVAYQRRTKERPVAQMHPSLFDLGRVINLSINRVPPN